MGWMTGIRFLAVAKEFSLLDTVKTGSGDHPASYAMAVEVAWA
jgi:hypothetical protein